jgi:SAM-dependent methyltransferase
VAQRGDVPFDRVADSYDATRGGAERATAAADDVREHLPPGLVLEIGTGTGIVAEALLASAPQVTGLAGVDISAPMLAHAARRIPGRALRASALRLPFGPATFDAVVAVHLLHLVPDLGATLAEAARVLRPGGRFVAVHGRPVHDRDDDLDASVRGLAALMGPPPDPPEVVRAAAEAAGLRCLLQRPATPHVMTPTPAQLAALVEARSWSALWNVDEAGWREHVEPVLAELRALPDQDRPRRQEARRTLSVFEREGPHA